MATQDTIDAQIYAANLQEKFNVYSGHCLSIAIALQDYFGGDILVCSQLEHEGFDHAVLKQNGHIYDGSGKVSWTETINRFIPKEQQFEDPNKHFRILEHPKTAFPNAYNKNIHKSVLTELQTAHTNTKD